MDTRAHHLGPREYGPFPAIEHRQLLNRHLRFALRVVVPDKDAARCMASASISAGSRKPQVAIRAQSRPGANVYEQDCQAGATLAPTADRSCGQAGNQVVVLEQAE